MLNSGINMGIRFTEKTEDAQRARRKTFFCLPKLELVKEILINIFIIKCSIIIVLEEWN